ncbi:MAG TPA: carboxypeptidase M32, partial [Phycisphaerae bacterium]|nr:carboxypeptidase M32 [Phycisphaerae bacterium]
MSAAYDEFIRHVRETGMLDATSAVLDWDAEVNMPDNGVPQRADQLALLAALSHERRTHPRIGELLGQLERKAGDEVQQTNVREVRRAYDRAVKIPKEIIQRIAHVSAIAKHAWAEARKESAFGKFAPHLTELLDLKRQVADAIGYPSERYDALLDEFEPGATAAEVADVFVSLRKPLSEFAKQIAGAARRPDASILARRYPIDRQKLWAEQCARTVGFDFKSGRIDVSTHPFCSGFGPGDVRLTTRYYENLFPASVFGTLHEAGHGLYEQGLPIEHVFTPRGQAVSLGIHESQSRMWENFVGRGRPFWERFFDQCKLVFHEALGDVSLDQFYGAINTVTPSLIRVEADEVTYNLHIILRF